MLSLGMVLTDLYMLFFVGGIQKAGNGKVFFLTSGW